MKRTRFLVALAGVALASPAAAADTAQRLADGSLFVPKAMQRALGVRTAVATAGEFPQVVELPGRVVADPRAGGRVQATQAGTIAAGGLAQVGQAVRQGQVLARLVPALDTAGRADRLAARADTAAQLTLAEARVVRLEQLAGSVPRKDIEQAAADLAALRARAAAQDTALRGDVALTAPAAGVVGASHVVGGQVVAAGQDVFEIVDPRRLAVEALSWDAALASRLAEGVADAGSGKPLPLRLLGAGTVSRDQAVPVVFAVVPGDAGAPAVAVGQSVKVFAHTAERQPGVAVAETALVREGNETRVWVHAGPERFVPRTVTTAPLDGARVRVVSGLAGGERVAVQGAQALAQVR